MMTYTRHRHKMFMLKLRHAKYTTHSLAHTDSRLTCVQIICTQGSIIVIIKATANEYYYYCSSCVLHLHHVTCNLSCTMPSEEITFHICNTKSHSNLNMCTLFHVVTGHNPYNCSSCLVVKY